MFRGRIIHTVLLLAMLAVGNLHLPALQVAAWVGMVVNYSRDNSVAEALEMTFDGDHPCPMCIAIRNEQAKANPEKLQAPTFERIVLFVEHTEPWIQSLIALDTLRQTPRTLSRFILQPEIPPPRAASC